VKPLSEVIDSVDAAAKAGAVSVYVEIIAVPGGSSNRTRRAPSKPGRRF
jgi:hypothetical protein